MLRKFIISLMMVGVTFAFAGCGNTEETPQDDVDSTETTEGTEVTETDEVEEVVVAAAPGEIPLDFPADLTTDSVEGDFVLAPSRAFLDSAFEDGIGASSFIFYNRTMVTPGEMESTIKELFDEVVMPNSLIIPIPRGETAQVGDIILTWWQSGSGLTRAIVVDGGSDTEPMVKYLGLGIDNEPERIELDSFVKLTADWQAGTVVACKDDGDYLSETLIRVEGDQVLTSGFAGSLELRSKANCKPVVINPTIAVGDEVHVPVISSYRRGTVTAINAEYGEVTVTYEFAGSESEDVFSFGEIATDL